MVRLKLYANHRNVHFDKCYARYYVTPCMEIIKRQCKKFTENHPYNLLILILKNSKIIRKLIYIISGISILKWNKYWGSSDKSFCNIEKCAYVSCGNNFHLSLLIHRSAVVCFMILHSYCIRNRQYKYSLEFETFSDYVILNECTSKVDYSTNIKE